jgi:hypothetical protein
MERLPYIDTYARRIDAPAERVWDALLTVLRRQLRGGLPRPVTTAWGLQHTACRGDWKGGVAVGDTITGFAVAAVQPLRVLALRGQHRFSRYELRFELDSSVSGGIELRAITSAVFPGLHGRIYRLLVIGSGGHRVAVRRLLGGVAGSVRSGRRTGTCVS